MAAIFRPKYAPPGQTYAEARAAGTLRESAVWWARFQQHGKTVKQSTDTRDKAKAKAFLEQQTSKIALKIPVDVQAERLTLTDGAELIRRDYRTNARKSAATLEYRLARLVEHFGAETRLSRITTAAVQTSTGIVDTRPGPRTPPSTANWRRSRGSPRWPGRSTASWSRSSFAT